MLIINEIIILLILIFLINFFSKKWNILLDNKYSKHKTFSSSDSTPLTGGIFFLIVLIIYFPHNFYLIKFFFFLIFLLGLFSDLNLVSSPKKRIIFQIIIIGGFAIISDNYINSIRIDMFDNYLDNLYVKLSFTVFCYLVLINGSNFIDGMNSLLLGYFSLVLAILTILAYKNNLNLEIDFLIKILILMMILTTLNFFGLLFAGDNGAYLISFIVGYFLIKFSNENLIVSPYFIVSLLWYPAYENLFSIIRKKISSSNAFDADSNHLHQIIFKYVKKKLSLNQSFCNNFTSLIINTFNLIIFYFAFINYKHTMSLVLIIIFAVLVYNLTYFVLLKKLSRLKDL